MPATLTLWTPPGCTCGRPATHIVKDKFGNLRGLWCKACGTTYVAQLNAQDQPKTPPKQKSKR